MLIDRLLFASLSAVFVSYGGAHGTPPPQAAQLITAEGLAAHIQVLASDEFEGRAPATRGEELTVAYLRGQFESLGLQPGNHGDWFQTVPLVKITPDPSTRLHRPTGRRLRNGGSCRRSRRSGRLKRTRRTRGGAICSRATGSRRRATFRASTVASSHWRSTSSLTRAGGAPRPFAGKAGCGRCPC